ncbi:SRPBCC family protein [Cryomorphaceae bacterium]|nr:SRPBCC family protein [Cryomorphaceae bacterium]
MATTLSRAQEKKYPKTVVSVDVDSKLSLKESFEYIVPIDLEHIFNEPYKMIPKIDSTSNREAWFTPNENRIVYFNDGSTSQEELLSVTPPSGFTYKVTGFTSSLRMLIKQINGSWTFKETGDGKIHIEWTYEFVPKNFFARFLVKNVVIKQIKVPMTNALNIMKQELESGELYQYKRRVGNW